MALYFEGRYLYFNNIDRVGDSKNQKATNKKTRIWIVIGSIITNSIILLFIIRSNQLHLFIINIFLSIFLTAMTVSDAKEEFKNPISLKDSPRKLKHIVILILIILFIIASYQLGKLDASYRTTYYTINDELIVLYQNEENAITATYYKNENNQITIQTSTQQLISLKDIKLERENIINPKIKK